MEENKEVIKFLKNILDPEPTGGEKERSGYVSKVSGFFSDVLKEKLDFLINETREELSQIRNKRDYDLILKGTINAFCVLNDWGNDMLNEALSYQTKKKVENILEDNKK